MSVMGKELQKLAKHDKSFDFNYGNDMKYLHRAMMNGLHFPPRPYTPTLQLVQIEKADKSPLRKVISNCPGLNMLGLYSVMHLRLASAFQNNLFVLSLCVSMIAHHHNLLASSRAEQGI